MPEPPRTRFVGRDPELTLLRAELDAALGGEGHLVALLGEPGIGKTHTATFLASEARERGVAVAWGRCHEGGAAPAYWPWSQALRAFAAALDGDAAERVARLVPLLREGSEASDAADVPARARFALFAAVATTLAAAARSRPLLLVLDDLHWADVGSVLLLHLVARELGATRLLVLATLRDADLRQRPEVATLVQNVLRHGRNVPLAGLLRPDVHDLLADRLGFAPSAAVVDRVLAASEGNPFFVVEMAQLLAASDASGIPAGVAALLRRRLEPLNEASCRLLRAAAVVGREFDLATLAAVLDESPEDLLAALDAPLALGVVRQVSGRPRHYAFAHVLMRDCLYETLAPLERAHLHAAVGRALDAAAALDDERPALLAHHFLAAVEGGGDPCEAARWACHAGERALHLLSFEEAASHFERALATLRLADDPAARLRALVGLAGALHGAGEPSRAEPLLREALVIARRAGSEIFAETALRCAAVRSEIGVLDVEINDRLEEALAALPDAPSALRARVMSRLAAGLVLAPGSHQRRQRLADEATAMARALGDRATLAFVLSRRLTALLGPDNMAERLATLDEIARSRTDEPMTAVDTLDTLLFRIGDLAESGNRTGLDHALTLFEQRMRASRDPFLRWTLASCRTALALLEGRYADGEALAADALALGQQAQSRTAVLSYAQQLFLLRGEQARFADVEPLLVSGVSETAVVPAWRCGLADFYSVSGRMAEARSELDALAADGFASLPRDAAWLTAMVLVASVCCRLEDERRGAVVYDLLRPYAGRVAIARPLVVFVGPIDERLGALAALLGRFDAAEQHFASALALAERMRARPWHGHVRCAWAGMLQRRGAPGDRARAAALLDQAEAIARPLGMTLLLRWIGDMRAGARPEQAAPGGEDAARLAGTFRREGELWTLAFAGRVTRLRHMVGLAHLARLLAEPARDVHVSDLVDAAYERSRNGDERAVLGDAGEQLDAQARVSYTARLRAAREELDDAQADNDRGRMERLEEEITFLESELARSYGLAGRVRRAGSAHERARMAVTRSIKYALDRVAAQDARLAEHLRGAVRTGVFCSYEPTSRERVDWSL
jgi:hypothetical protein